MSRKAAHARTKFYLAVFAVGLIASGIVIGTQFSRQLSASANPTQSTGTVTKVSDNEYVYTNGKTVYHYNRFWSLDAHVVPQ